jgi:hypothetical protein
LTQRYALPPWFFLAKTLCERGKPRASANGERILMGLLPYAVVWLAAACTVLGLAVYRNLMAHYREDDYLHLKSADSRQVSRQAFVSARLDFIDRWGKTLTIAVAAFGIVLAATAVYQQWVDSAKLLP